MDKQIVDEIKKLAKVIREENGIINEIIRDDVFFVLQACDCSVLYYPLLGEEDDGCDGFHIRKPVGEKIEQFVFINTNNTRERQAFSAAHELGHMWNVDKRIREKCPEQVIDTEKVINRFAAELLMPEELFKKVLADYLEKISYTGPYIKETELVKVIAYLMNYFFVPYKSVVYRFNEINKLDEQYNERILSYKDGKFLKEIIKDEQYTRLGIVNQLKSMDNLQEYLLKAEKSGLINPTKASNIRKCFDIEIREADTGENVVF